MVRFYFQDFDEFFLKNELLLGRKRSENHDSECVNIAPFELKYFANVR